MCELFALRNILFVLSLGISCNHCLGNRVKIIQRFKRQSVKEGRCPSWAVIRNCSSLEQCIWDRDCSGSQKCCKSTCETRSCYEPILRIGPNEDACPRDDAMITSHKKKSDCVRVRTRFCFKSSCKRCCFHYTSCNPQPELLTSKDECRKVLCSTRVCRVPGEVCLLDKFNHPRCSCRAACPTPLPEENVCGTDGIPYDSACELNRTACILGTRNIKIQNYGNCHQNGVKVKVSTAHKKKQVLPAYRHGELTCRFEGDPVSITWQKVGLQTLPNRMVPRMDKLNILDVDMQDSGIYKCMAYDGFSTAEAAINVTVNGPSSGGEHKLPVKDCLKPQSIGYCKRYAVRWYYDGEAGVCRPFAYGGCGGNKNNFPSQEACSFACSHAAGDICNLPKIEGPCRGFILQWFYNSNSWRCEQFVYGGCGGNTNRFSTKMMCQERCVAEPSANSPCLQQQLEARRNKHLGVFVPNCRPDGEYGKIQCHKSVCFCADEDGREVPNTRVSRHKPLNCIETSRKVAGFTACQIAQQNSTDLSFGSSYPIRCKQDGSYEEVQCSGSNGYCWCVDKNGVKLNGTETRGALKCPTFDDRLTLCQRQYLENSRSPLREQEYVRCHEDGSFEEIQCNGTICFCVDLQNGWIVKDTSISALFGEPRCGDTGYGLTLCQRMHQESLISTLRDIYVPQCTVNGSFVEIQCYGPSNECWCVDQQGRELPGTKVTGPLQCVGVGQPLTECQKEYQKNLRSLQPFLLRYVPRCSADGSYQQVQCAGGVCYCVTPQGKQIPGSKTFNSARKPNCTEPDSNITPCEKKRREAIFSSKKFIPFCKPDGSWSEIQCERSSRNCWCVDSGGKEVPGTRSRNLEKCPDFDCFQFSGKLSPCRRRLMNLLKSTHPSRHPPWCRVDGSYNPMQCYGSYCYCVQENGNEQPGTKISVVVGKPVCTYTSGTVTDCQRRYQEATLPSFQGNFVPQCKLDGQYEAVQCQGSNGECWCVDQDGKEISGTRTTQALKCPVSASSLTICQQQYIEYAKNPAPGKMLPRCKKDGTFDPLQCQGPYCFCVDNEGNQIEGTSLPIGLGKPKCGRPGNETLSICQKQRNEALQLTGKHFNFIPTCKRNGRFEEIQCLRATSECWCVDESGKEISGTRTTGLLKCPIAASPLSQCQKEYQEIIRSWILPGPYIPQCTHEGQYELIQCERQYCFCVNEYGVELFGSRVDIVEGKPKCHSGGLFLTLCQKQFQDYLRHPVAGRFEPRCGKDGAFQDTQCHENVCFCVSREGNEIPSTRQSIAMGKPVCYRPERSLTKCQKQLQEAIHLSPERKRFVPRCKFNGDFEEIQCHNSSGLCWCVDKKGNEVLSTGTNQTIQCPFTETNSLCWTRYQQIVRSGVAGTHVPWCKPDGSFSPLQIQGSQFFCVNDRGDEVPGTSVDVGLGKPDCRAATSRGYIVTPCQRERARRSYLPLVAGRYVPRCKVDGTYDEVQCDMMLGQCWCVDRDGKEMNGSRSEGVVRCPNKGNLTSCQKRQKRAKELSNSGSDPWNFVPRCREDGGYYEVQCHVSTGQCWCVDENGNERWGTIVRGLPNCSANIMACQRHRIRALGLAGNPPPATYVPFCKDDGSYGDVQCHSFTGLCWCVDKKGREILGTRKWGRPRCSTLLPGQKTPLDLGILIDVSDTSVSTNWTRMLNFVSSIVASFDISASGSHVGLITFSSDAEIQLYFNTLRENNLTVENVTRAVNNVIPKKGMSRFDVAMSLAEEELFNEATGMRHEIPKAILLVTSGQQSRNQGPYTTLSASTQGLKDKGVFIFAVGIGTKIIVPELMDLASDYRNVFVADHPSALQSGGTVLADVIRNKTKVLATKDRICNLPPEPGQLGCLASISAFYFEAASGECHSFVYSGCGGNANNFPSYEKCMNFCKGVLPSCIEEKKRLLSLQVDHFSPKCKTNGRYEDVQCYGKTGYCWCVDEYGREVPGTRTMGFPICNLATVFGKLTPCLEERRKALGMVGVPSVGRFVPECNQDGEYANIQCFGNTNFCWCSDKNGYEIAGTHRWGTPECPAEVRPGVCPFISDPTKCSVTQQTCSQDSDCPGSSKCCDCGCVRQCTFVSLDKLGAISSCVSEHIKSLSSSCPHFRAPGRFYPKCKPDGGYEELQCNEPYGVCWCVDKDGNEIPGSRRTGKPNCTTQVAMTPCQREHRRALSMVSRSSVGMFIASCQLDGSYDSIQCHNVTGYCWCVDSNGSELAGTRQWGKPNCTGISKTSTVCQSRYDECLDNAPPGHFIPRCKIDGSYKERQCLQSTGECWCVDKNGNELPGTRSREMHDCSLLAWLSPCQINRRQALGLKSVPVMGLHAPECKADGGFNNIQCQMTSGYCWCVDQFGTEVQGSRMKGRPSCDKKLACKKESEGILEAFPTPPPGMFVPQCSKDGGYQATQCHASTGFCWCVDEYGNELTGTRMRGSLNCTALKHPKLSLCHSGYNKATEVNERGHHVPQCEPGGSYKQIQCYSASGECWCVDREGKEKLETRRIGKPHCQVKDSGINCELPPDAGPCKANMPSWFFNTTAGACAVFIYGGCNGNGNRFSSYSDCQDSCHGRNLTLCELQREINRGQSEDFIPGCTKDGEFEEVQCQVSSGECWCVDKAGIEIVDSRMLGLPSCNLLDEGIGSRGAR